MHTTHPADAPSALGLPMGSGSGCGWARGLVRAPPRDAVSPTSGGVAAAVACARRAATPPRECDAAARRVPVPVSRGLRTTRARVKEAEPGCRDGAPPSPERPREVVRAGREDMAASGGSAAGEFRVLPRWVAHASEHRETDRSQCFARDLHAPWTSGFCSRVRLGSNSNPWLRRQFL